MEEHENEEYLSDSEMSEVDTYFSEEEILCGFVRNEDSTSCSDKDTSDEDTQPKFPERTDYVYQGEKPSVSEDLQIYPEEQRHFLKLHYPAILNSLEELSKESAILVYVSHSLLSELQQKVDKRPQALIGDLCVFSTRKPVRILTVSSSEEKTTNVVRYNAKAARVFKAFDSSHETNTKRRLLDESVTSRLIGNDEYTEYENEATATSTTGDVDKIIRGQQQRNCGQLDNGAERIAWKTHIAIHDVLKDIGVIATVLSKNEWQSQDSFLKSVKEAEELAKLVELPDLLEMDQNRYDNITKSFFCRVALSQSQKSQRCKSKQSSKLQVGSRENEEKSKESYSLGSLQTVTFRSTEKSPRRMHSTVTAANMCTVSPTI